MRHEELHSAIGAPLNKIGPGDESRDTYPAKREQPHDPGVDAHDKTTGAVMASCTSYISGGSGASGKALTDTGPRREHSGGSQRKSPARGGAYLVELALQADWFPIT